MNKASFEKLLEPLNNFWQGLDKKKKIYFAASVSLVILIIFVSVAMASKKEYDVLYNNLDPKEAGEIVNLLKEQNVGVDTRGEGTILVPKKELDSIRMMLASEGYPKSTLNYDVFQNSTGFGTTDFEKQKYMQFQIQERLQNSIKTLEVVEDAIVTIHIPDNNIYVLQKDKQNASASVILKLKDRDGLSRQQIKGIQGLIAKSVPGLTEENIFMIDSMGNSLKTNAGGETEVAGTKLDLENSVSERLRQQVLSLLEPVFGYGNVTAAVRVVLDFDKQTTESVTYAPVGDNDEGIAISSSYESEESVSAGSSGNVGQDPNGGAPQYMQQGESGNEYKKVNKTTNYEVNQKRDTIQKAEGKIEDIFVSVLIDESNLPKGLNIENSIAKVNDIVSGAVGVDKSKVTVQSMEFSESNRISSMFDEIQKSSARTGRDRLLRNAVIFAVLALALLFVLLYLIKKHRASTVPVIDEVIDDYSMKDYDFSVNKSEKREFIERSIEKNPELIAQLLRNWLNEEVL